MDILLLNKFFEKTAISEKIAKNHLWEDMIVWRGAGRLATKVAKPFFVVGIEVLNIFHLTIFWRKNNIFQNNHEKNFCGVWPFLRERVAKRQKWI